MIVSRRGGILSDNGFSLRSRYWLHYLFFCDIVYRKHMALKINLYEVSRLAKKKIQKSDLTTPIVHTIEERAAGMPSDL